MRHARSFRCCGGWPGGGVRGGDIILTTRLALAQINPTVGHLAGNARIIIDRIGRARDEGAEVVIFPELAMCGYPPKDLLLQEGFIRAAIEAAREIGEQHTRGLTAVLGLPTPADEASLRQTREGRHPSRIANSL